MQFELVYPLRDRNLGVYQNLRVDNILLEETRGLYEKILSIPQLKAPVNFGG